MRNDTPTRRTVLARIAAGGLALPVLAACGEAARTPAPKAGQRLAETSKVPVGGGLLLESAELVITQPTAGTFKCFSAVCTHQGCIVGAPANGVITCPCHGSEFSITDGRNLRGPSGSAAGAVGALAKEPIRIASGEITLA